MASTDQVTPANRPIYIGDVESNRPNSEAINRKIAGSLNFVLERLYLDMKFPYSGYFNANSFDNGVGGIEVIESDCVVSRYTMGISNTGSSGTNSFNIAVYDSAGAFVNNLFGSGGNALSVTGASGTYVVVGKQDVDTGSPTNLLINTAGHTAFNGTLNLGTTLAPLLAGYMLIPYIVSNANAALNLSFSLRCKEL